jgi:hypothetical protein
MGAPPGVALAFAERAAKPAIYSEAAVGEIPRWAADRQNFVRERAGETGRRYFVRAGQWRSRGASIAILLCAKSK